MVKREISISVAILCRGVNQLAVVIIDVVPVEREWVFHSLLKSDGATNISGKLPSFQLASKFASQSETGRTVDDSLCLHADGLLDAS